MLKFTHRNGIEECMKHFNSEEIREELRKYIAVNHKHNYMFAQHVGCATQSVTNVLKGRQEIPSKWLELMGYESVTIYRKVKK